MGSFVLTHFERNILPITLSRKKRFAKRYFSFPPCSKDLFKLDTTDLGDLIKIVVRMDITKGTGLFGKIDDWYLLKVGEFLADRVGNFSFLFKCYTYMLG
jgi:hypothetical protein